MIHWAAPSRIFVDEQKLVDSSVEGHPHFVDSNTNSQTGSELGIVRLITAV